MRHEGEHGFGHDPAAGRRCRAVVVLGGRPRPPAAVEAAFRRAGIELIGYAESSASALSLLGRRQPEALVAEGTLTERPEDEGEFLRRAYEVDPRLTAILIADELSNLEDLFAAAAAHSRDDGRLPRREGSPPDTGDRQLTRREIDVLQLAAQGLSNTQIARRLWVTRDTVKFHLANAYRKLGARSRLEAVGLARARRLLDA